MFKLFCVVLGLAQLICASEIPPPCHSDIYCHGPLLHTVQMSKIYEDSKTFVDMKMKQDATTTMQSFLAFMKDHNDEPDRAAVIQFVNDTFDAPGKEFEDWIPDDWIEHPAFIDHIEDANYTKFALHLNHVWKDLGRKMREEIKTDKDKYSIIWVPNPVIVPGGRFREFYYWDSYWIVQGLLLSQMDHTVKGMLENFAYIVDNYGHIPNGGRVYYLQRSQPPLFVPMVKSYYDYTKDLDFIRDNIKSMDSEFNFWLKNHSRIVELDNKNYTLLAYGDYSTGPRPESYSEDMDSGKFFKEYQDRESYFSELKAAAESGWDFSSRWFIFNGTNKGNLTNIKTRSIIPVDLNAIFYWNADILAGFHDLLGNKEKSAYYAGVAAKWLDAVDAVLWHEETGSWLDYDVQNAAKRDYFFPSNLAPLWTGCFKKEKAAQIAKYIVKYLELNNAFYPGGVPTSRDHTGEQWDYPNAWPPLQHMIIVGLNNTGDASAKRLAYEIADVWVRSNYKAYLETEAMFEKYDATKLGGHGGGGEYEVQLGFGWSNGVIMDLLYRYADKLRFSAKEDDPKKDMLVDATKQSENIIKQSSMAPISSGNLMTAFIALVATVAAGFIG